MANQTIANYTGINFLDTFLSGVLTDIVITVLILLMGFVIGRVVNSLLKKFLSNLKIDDLLRKKAKIKISVESIITSLITLVIYLVAIILALNKLGITTFLLNIISIAIIILLTFSAIISIKDFIPNAIAGIRLSFKEIIKKGDKISFDNMDAVVHEITLTETKLESKSGDIIFIPNSLLLKKTIKIIKETKTNKK